LKFAAVQILVAIATTFLFTGCRTTALIHKKDGTVIEGDIRRSDKSTIFVVPSTPSDREKGTVIAELLDECVTERTLKCKQRCRDGFPSDYSRDVALKCMKSCPDHDTAKSQCEVISVEIPIARSDIVDIDHPGSLHACIGLSASAAGLAGFIAMYFINKNTGENGLSGNQATGMIVSLLAMISGAISIPVWIWGTIVWADSTSAAVPPRKPGGPKIRPVALSDGERSYYGLGLVWIW
jgi:hypothetical protein